jgi:hypothetical protein
MTLQVVLVAVAVVDQNLYLDIEVEAKLFRIKYIEI